MQTCVFPILHPPFFHQRVNWQMTKLNVTEVLRTSFHAVFSKQLKFGSPKLPKVSWSMKPIFLINPSQNIGLNSPIKVLMNRFLPERGDAIAFFPDTVLALEPSWTKIAKKRSQDFSCRSWTLKSFESTGYISAKMLQSTICTCKTLLNCQVLLPTPDNGNQNSGIWL